MEQPQRRSSAVAIAWTARVVGALALSVGAARAETVPAVSPSSLLLVGAGAGEHCPAPEAVATVLAPLLPRTRVTLVPAAGALVVRVADAGAAYRIGIGPDEREFLDGDRRCDERARAAAVFIALTVEPPTVPPALGREAGAPPGSRRAEAGPTARPPSAAPAEAAIGRGPPSRPPSSVVVDLELAALLDGAPQDGLLGGGGAARLAVGTRYLQGAVGAAVLSPATLALPAGAAARVLRAPFDLDVRGVLRRGRLEGAADLGFSLALLSIEGQGFSPPRSDVRVEPGLRGALSVRVRLVERVALFAGLEARVVPQPHQLTSGATVLATLPLVWLGGAVGLLVRLH
jgi:hypothetical protein